MEPAKAHPVRAALAPEGGPTRGFLIGYRAPTALADEIATTRRRSPFLTAGRLLADHAVAYGTAGAAAAALLELGVAGVPVAAAATVVIARAQRGLECGVHEASHRTISANPMINDGVGDVLAAIPVASRVALFRAAHDLHHKRFAVAREHPHQTRVDPDLARSAALGWAELDWTNPLSFARTAIPRLPAYMVDWFRSIGSGPRTLVLTVAWHLFVLSVLMATVGDRAAMVVEGLWFLAFVLVLPVHRFIAEAQEHDYTAGDTQFATTISNTGWLNAWLHPHGDGHHAEHHTFVNHPGVHLRRLARILREGDPEVWGRGHLHRRRVFERRRRGH